MVMCRNKVQGRLTREVETTNSPSSFSFHSSVVSISVTYCHASGCSKLAHVCRRVTGEMQAEPPAQPGRALACAAPCGYDRRRRLRMVLWSVQFCASAAVLLSDGLLLLHCCKKAVYA